MHPIRDYREAGRCGIVSAAIVAATILLAIAFAVPASAETTNSLTGAAAPVAAGSAPVEEAPTVSAGAVQAPIEEVEALIPAPEPVEAQEAAGGADLTSAPPVESSAPAALPSASSPRAAALPDDLPTPPAAPAAVRTSAVTESDAAGGQVTKQASELVEGVRQAPPTTAAAIAEHVAQTVPGPASLVEQSTPGHALLETVDRTLRIASVVEPLFPQAIESVREVLDLVTPPIVESLLPSASAIDDLLSSTPAPVGDDPPASAGQAWSFAGLAMADPVAGERALTTEGSSLAKHMGAFGGVEALRPGRSGGAADLAGSTSRAMPVELAGAYRGSVTGSRPDNAPPDRPAPPFKSPGATAGSGGSSFVPLAALLALLALVAPATFRRRREVPDFLAPPQFACALERPG